ncbi:MAG TPA: hypothetical protein VHS06_07650, partial [Chloroflexota bacterium]|nr:hypothetical protein [Chloroflexota bacterium]
GPVEPLMVVPDRRKPTPEEPERGQHPVPHLRMLMDCRYSAQLALEPSNIIPHSLAAQTSMRMPIRLVGRIDPATRQASHAKHTAARLLRQKPPP